MLGLTFLQPAFLLAGLAAGVPILIHLINRHRALVHRFPALRFLLMADRRTARKFRLYQLLLLAYGTLLGQFEFFWTKFKAVGRLLTGRIAGAAG